MEKEFYNALDKKKWDLAKSMWIKNPDTELMAEWLFRRVLHDSFMEVNGESDTRYPVIKAINHIKPYLIEIWNKVIESDEEKIHIIDSVQISLSEMDFDGKPFQNDEFGERIYLIIATMVEAQKHNFDFEKILSELKALKKTEKLFQKNEYISRLIRLVEKQNGHDVSKMTMESTESWSYKGAKPGGSNPGAIYHYYLGDVMVKWGKQQEVLGNEFLANRIYRALRLAVPEMKLIKHENKIALASHMLNSKAYHTRPEEYQRLWKGFAADAWLRNWDVVNSGNVMTLNGVVYRVDVG
jgi:hypothetical protein